MPVICHPSSVIGFAEQNPWLKPLPQLLLSPRRMAGSGDVMRENNYYVYIMAKARNSTFYTGVTNNLIRLVYEHKNNLADGFEKLIKKWKREYKLNVIEELNPNWRDLYFDLTGADPAMRRGDSVAIHEATHG
jgi:putative endonuclease